MLLPILTVPLVSVNELLMVTDVPNVTEGVEPVRFIVKLYNCGALPLKFMVPAVPPILPTILKFPPPPIVPEIVLMLPTVSKGLPELIDQAPVFNVNCPFTVVLPDSVALVIPLLPTTVLG